jgi:hypothetical protein
MCGFCVMHVKSLNFSRLFFYLACWLYRFGMCYLGSVGCVISVKHSRRDVLFLSNCTYPNVSILRYDDKEKSRLLFMAWIRTNCQC